MNQCRLRWLPLRVDPRHVCRFSRDVMLFMERTWRRPVETDPGLLHVPRTLNIKPVDVPEDAIKIETPLRLLLSFSRTNALCTKPFNMPMLESRNEVLLADHDYEQELLRGVYHQERKCMARSM
jgi:hypothetical protein